ncbi:glycosyltransferase [Colwellia echini]|uniref:Glycosyltransferase n=1 Tax=Colwellia echini TaxID=1982103 RepID=A0ABY3MX62_9GAMM|nr:glycosyltransferase [Colwellia echini]TYK65756.1 glycosyltransferase [Colwellia echini]
MEEKIVVSFIIPAFNEANMIVDTLTQLHKFAPKVGYEIIIVDNGSTDNTIELAQHFGDTVISCAQGTIAAVRNFGVQVSTGRILVFIDADVKLTQQWQDNINNTIENIDKNPLLITGSRCSPPENNNTLNTHWFNLLVESNSSTYINSGHLITSKVLFDKISGFNEELRTAEDHDFCIRATQAEALISPNASLKVFHDGYPTTYAQFIKRERWHGREDFKSFTSLFNSKIALIICFHVMLFMLSLAIVYLHGIIAGVSFYALSMFILTLALTRYKFNGSPMQSLMKTSLIHYAYIIGRTLSLVDRLTFRYSSKFR